ncbi:MAG: hypothetical protein H6581_14195 [Bacteroidia bacterium]|nr:hypothetical protein [Bacteroidia bacterium]
MKKLFLLILPILLACTQKTPFSCVGKSPPRALGANFTLISHQHLAILFENEKPAPCHCQPSPLPAWSQCCNQVQITLDLGSFGKKKYEKTLSDWSHPDSVPGQVRSLLIYNVDTLPDQLRLFSKVETLVLATPRNLENLAIFPHLKTLVIEEYQGPLTLKKKEFPDLQRLVFHKTYLHPGFDFAEISQLQELRFAYAGFKEWPENFDQMTCLKILEMGAYNGEFMDLSQLDLSKFPCLTEATFQTWYDKFTSLPQGILPSNLKKLKVQHQKLTEADRELLAAFVESRQKP